MVKLSIDTSNSSAAVHTTHNSPDKQTPTPSSSSSSSSPTYNTVRGRSDIRSPGISKTPSIVKPVVVPPSPTSTTQVPDFITQTDKYGNASTPRTPSALAAYQQREDQKREEESAASSEYNSDESDNYNNNNTTTKQNGVNVPPDEDACDTLLDSLRMMCCCLAPETTTTQHIKTTTTVHHPTNDTTERKMQITRQRRGNGSGNGNGGGPIYGHIDERANFINAHEEIKLLPEIVKEDEGKPCLVLDLDETLVHSSFRAVAGADFVIPVQIEDVVHYVYVAKRPGVDEFLIEMAKYYEIILYTASLNKYADPLLDLLDPHRTIRTRLFRESCVYYEGNYVKDLGLLNRDLSKTIIVDNSPSSYIFHPKNAIDCTSFIDDPTDVELDQIGSFLKDVRNVKDVRAVCGMWKQWPNINISEAEMEDLVESREEKHGQ